MKKELSLGLDKDYVQFLENTKHRLKMAQMRAALAVNRESIQFYWQLGADLIEKQRVFNWGDRFLEQFSDDIRQSFPGMQGFSVTNLKRMRLFAQEYPEFEKSAQAVHQLPWGHIILLLHRVKQIKERTWYVEQTLENGWSRSILEMQIETDLFNRQGNNERKISNFHQHLPPLQSNLATEILKDPYQFDFLTIQGKAHERAIETALIAHMRDFLLELGQGFAFVGSQVPLTFDDQEFFIDLLFWHLKLKSFIVIELKSTKFKPEHTGQLGFYLAAVDDQLRQPGDNKTIGILLCKSKNRFVAEYALQNISAPIGVSEYVLSKALPKDLKTSLPAIEEIEAELNEIVKKTDEDENNKI
jgi:predicted nuclease of restriction endonuclease-like (RecB) superfamily